MGEHVITSLEVYKEFTGLAKDSWLLTLAVTQGLLTKVVGFLEFLFSVPLWLSAPGQLP